MKKLSDYKGEEAIELWGDLLEPFGTIFADKSIANIVRSGKPTIVVAGQILKKYKKEAVQIIERIDDTPVDGLNIIKRLLVLLAEIGSDREMTDFFGLSERGQTEGESTGSATEITEDGGK